jgi:prepilin-type N-terminal cleavage/methylation domain-containing protein/prepilin-type processing-associated H-X9-DG protein
MDLPSLANKTRAGFTLIELLIVIAIMAVLAAISVPAVNKALASSRSSKCLSNLRQLGTALLSYPADNNGYLPRVKLNPIPNPDPGESTDADWAKAVYNYIPTKDNTMSGPQVNKVFLCPAEKQTSNIDSSTYQYTASRSMEAGSSATTPTGTDTEGKYNGPRTTVSIEKPSQTILLVDGKIGMDAANIYKTDSSTTWNALNSDIQKSGSTQTAKVSFRHSSVMNAVYADGHVGTIAWADRKDTNRLSETIWIGRTP